MASKLGQGAMPPLPMFVTWNKTKQNCFIATFSSPMVWVCKVRKSYGPHYKVTRLLHWAVKMNRVYMSLYYPVCTHCWKHNSSLTTYTSPEVLCGLITWLFKYSSHWGGIVLWNPLWQDSKLKLEIISLKYQRISVKSNIFKILTFPLTCKMKILH